jgi:hypothetical protein
MYNAEPPPTPLAALPPSSLAASFNAAASDALLLDAAMAPYAGLVALDATAAGDAGAATDPLTVRSGAGTGSDGDSSTTPIVDARRCWNSSS